MPIDGLLFRETCPASAVSGPAFAETWPVFAKTPSTHAETWASIGQTMPRSCRLMAIWMGSDAPSRAASIMPLATFLKWRTRAHSASCFSLSASKEAKAALSLGLRLRQLRKEAREIFSLRATAERLSPDSRSCAASLPSLWEYLSCYGFRFAHPTL
jgi:hypothetical protein